MFFLYIDGSGNTRIKKKNPNNGFYVLSGIIVHERDWNKVEEDLSELKKKIFPNLEPNDWELHAHHIWNSTDFFSESELHLNLDKKNDIFSKVIEFICNSNVTLINVIVLKDKLNSQYITPKAKEYSWTILVERFEGYLRNQPEETNNGLLFVDSDQKIPEKEIKDIVWKLVRRGSIWQSVDHVIEDPIFTKSHLRNLIQLADMIAYVIHKHYKEDHDFEKWFESLIPKMYQPEGKLNTYGLKEFPD